MRSLIRRAAPQNKAFVAVAAINITTFVNLKPYARVAKGGTARNVACTVACDPSGFNNIGFGLTGHVCGDSNGGRRVQSGY